MLPDVPTLAEAGIPNHESEFAAGLLVPAGTPADVIELLHRQIARIMMLPAVKERLAMLGLALSGWQSRSHFAHRAKLISH
jgi:tripartite-type tricarboxylate transporter receptor subunit TctC